MPVRNSRSTTRATQEKAQESAQPKQPKPDLKAVPDAQPGKPLPSETPKAKPKDAKPRKPAAAVDLGMRQVPMWFPSATLSGGETVTCPHQRYGHESEAAAKRCISALVAQRGHRLA